MAAAQRSQPMPVRRLLAFLLAAAAAAALVFLLVPRPPRFEGYKKRPGPYPSDWFGMQRAFPAGSIDNAAYHAALEQARVERAARAFGTQDAGAVWQQVGPFNIGGRVTALTVVPGGNTVYLGAANGGVFKSVNAGVNWSPVFDVGAAYSIGALCLDPNDAATLYVGTGEANGAIDTYDGAGLFRTRDGGTTWEHLGLAQTRRIARVTVDPTNSSRIFVAAMGGQFSTGPDRGLYRSEDGGASWDHVLAVNDSTGACEVALNPAHPETVFCATWERIRRPTYRRASGPGSGIWRSIDSGDSWQRLSAGLPTPTDSVGRIALAVAPSRPSTVYAQIIGGPALGLNGLGMYRTQDGGATWARRDASNFRNAFGGFGWYFGDMAVDPQNPNRVYALGVDFRVSSDGGANFGTLLGSGANAAHVDQHAIWIDPANPSRIYLGNDGGFYWSLVGGTTWNKSVDLPITQFYAGAIDPADPARLMGGTQDNNTLLTTGSPAGWLPVLGGDGFWCLIDPADPDVIFAEYQFGSGGAGPLRSSDGGVNFFAGVGIDPGERFNWSAPFVMNPLNRNTLLAGGARVFKSLDNGAGWAPISGDLTTNRGDALVVYSTITTLEIARADTNTYYAGTDDARVWRTTDAGQSWTEITAGLPTRWVTRVATDPRDARVVYATLSGFSLDERAAHVYRSADGGDTWASAAGNLPDVPANDIVPDPSVPGRLYLGNDIGVFASDDAGTTWYPLGTGLPLQAVFDLTLHDASRTLVAATHGRSQWKLDVGALPVAVGSGAARPARVALSAPAPNPARGEARFRVEAGGGAGRVEVAVFDVAGRRVRALWRGTPPAAGGAQALAWDGRDDDGRRLAPGVYYVRAAAGSGRSALQRLVLVE